MRTVRPTLLIVTALWPVLAGCQDDITRPEDTLPSAAELSQTLEPGIHAVVALPSASDWADGHAAVRIHLLAVQVPGSVQSYQGWIRFDPELMEVTEGTSPQGVLGAWNEVAEGEIRFAGVSIEGVGEDYVIELGVDASRPLVEGDLSIELDEVVGSVAEASFQDLTPSVRQSDVAPVISSRGTKR